MLRLLSRAVANTLSLASPRALHRSRKFHGACGRFVHSTSWSTKEPTSKLVTARGKKSSTGRSSLSGSRRFGGTLVFSASANRSNHGRCAWWTLNRKLSPRIRAVHFSAQRRLSKHHLRVPGKVFVHVHQPVPVLGSLAFGNFNGLHLPPLFGSESKARRFTQHENVGHNLRVRVAKKASFREPYRRHQLRFTRRTSRCESL